MAYLDHAATTPMLAEALEAYVAAAREVGNASSLHAAGRRARRRGRGVARAGRRGARRPPVRGDLHRRRHRERQPGGQGHLLGAPGRRPPGVPGRRQRGRAPRGARRGATGSAGTRAPRSPGCRSTTLGRVGVEALRAELDRARRRGRAGHRDVGQQRGRHGPAGRRRWPRWPPSAAIPFHTDADPGRRPGAGRLRRQRRRRADRHRAQARRPGRRRRAAARPRRRLHAAAARRRPGARRALGHARRGRHRRRSRSPSRPRSRARQEYAARVGALRDELVARVRAAVPDAISTATRPTGCPATRTSPSPAARATRCCCCSTRRASPAPPARPARPASPSRRTCCWPWAPTTTGPAPRCASPSATPRPTRRRARPWSPRLPAGGASGRRRAGRPRRQRLQAADRPAAR